MATSVLGSQNKFKAFGNNVAFQLMEDMDRAQQVIAEKLIADVLFYGKLGSLKPSASVTTDQCTDPKFNNYVEHNSNFYPGNRQNQPQNFYQNHYQEPFNFDSYNYQNPSTSNFFPQQNVNETMTNNTHSRSNAITPAESQVKQVCHTKAATTIEQDVA